jgi:cobalt-zinc-cadmium efflux system membrane fusion protein
MAFSNMRLARKSLDRAEKLKADSLVTGAAYQAAVKDLESANAEFNGLIEEMKLGYRYKFQQSEKSFRLAQSTLRNAERKLHNLGLKTEQVEKLVNESEDEISKIEVLSPIDGTILEKDIAVGERADESRVVFVIANLNELWLKLKVPSVSVSLVNVGQEVRVSFSEGGKSQVEKIDLISSVIDERTRTAMAKINVQNPEGKLRPGAFVSGAILLKAHQAPVVVPVSAVQTVEGKTVVFVQGDEDGEFVPKQVALGENDGLGVEVTAGLDGKAKVVTGNSFTLKAEMGKGEGGHDD